MIYNFDELCFKAISIDRFKHQNGVFNVAPRPFSALSLRICGEADFKIGNESFISKMGDILFVPSGVPYTANYSDSESIAIHIFDCNYSSFEHFESVNLDFTRELFENMLEAWQKERSLNKLKSEFFSLLQKLDELHSTMLDIDFLKCVKHIQSNYSRSDLSISELCRLGNMSISGLYRRFCAHFGLSPKQYILKLRLGYAVELLAKDRYTVKEAALMSGFSDEKYFSRLIKQRLGKPPSYFL